MDPNGGIGPQPQPAWPLRRVALIAGAIIIVIVAGVIALGLLGKKQAQPGKTTDTTLRIDRPGYSKNPGVGDAAALIATAGQVISYGGAPVIQACTVFSPSDVTAVGQRLSPLVAGGPIKRFYFDGAGAGTIITGSNLGLPFDDDSNTCIYDFDTDKPTHASLSVYQPSYTNMGAVDTEQNRRYIQIDSQAGLQAYQSKPTGDADLDKNSLNYLLRGNGFAAVLSVGSPDPQLRTNLLARVAANLAKAQTTPTPLLHFGYKSPIYTGGPVVTACDLLTNDVYKTAIGTDASPLVEEQASSSIDVISREPKPKQPTAEYNYVDSYCMRHNSVRTYLEGFSFQLYTTTYETVEGAKGDIAFKRSGSPFTKGVQATPATIGDESFYASDMAEAKHALAFRKGRVVIVASYSLPNGNDAFTDAQRLRTLVPALQLMVSEHLKDF